MDPVSVSIKTENLELPANHARHAVETDTGYTIEVSSVSNGEVRRLASNFSLALEYGAAPAAQISMVGAVQNFEEQDIPLHCVLSFGV